LIAKTISKFGAIDLLIFNAGIGIIGYLEHFEESDYMRLFDVNASSYIFSQVNVFGALRVVIPAIPYLRKSCGELAVVSSFVGTLLFLNIYPHTFQQCFDLVEYDNWK